MKGLSSKRIALKVDVTGLENTLFTSFGPEILHVGAVKGLNLKCLPL